jgi:small subunit ribosomal protein S8
MMVNDPIADMLTRIRNAVSSSHATVRIPYSKVKEAIAEILKSSGYVAGFKVEDKGVAKAIEITLGSDAKPVDITALVRVSKPSRRVYAASREIPSVLNGRGIVIVSTSNGIMTGAEARKRGLGGELICKVW